ncbi:probable site-specific integrase/recombinase [Rhodobacteraceae bacterium HTCC2150]|nr:probable site-specific integrase/recombinase [Rhodobacteraceae bacterium HTCC2150]
MATIRAHRGKWQAIIRRSGYPQQSKSFITKAHAVKWARQIEHDFDLGFVKNDTRLLDQTSMCDLLVRYRDTVTIGKKGHLSESIRINSFVKQHWAKLKLSTISSGVFSSYRDQRLKIVQPATVRRELGLLRAIFEVAIKEWDFPFQNNPLACVKKPKEPASRDRRLNPGERGVLLKASESHTAPWLKLGILLALETGMRRGELLSVSWGDLDIQSSTLLIQNTKNGYSRKIPLSKVAVDTLLNVHRPTNKCEDKIINLSSSAFQQSWQRCKKKVALNLPEILSLRFHDLRHEAVSRFFEIGLSVPEVALISGHRDPRMLFKYTHLRAEDIVHKINP